MKTELIKQMAPEQQQEQNLPQEAQQLPESAQKIFQAAMRSAQSDGLSQEGAMNVAWTTVKHDYVQGSDGKWQRKPEDEHRYKSTVVSGN
ncbi:ChaB family protein [Trichocoleus desertorum AS-A10]|uniref:ChaB family protein n=1 Tax=Trichocoleus desertorum TaxID=1481672 RepID=UPI0032988A25